MVNVDLPFIVALLPLNPSFLTFSLLQSLLHRGKKKSLYSKTVLSISSLFPEDSEVLMISEKEIRDHFPKYSLGQ